MLSRDVIPRKQPFVRFDLNLCSVPQSCPSADALISSLAERGSSLGAHVVQLCKLSSNAGPMHSKTGCGSHSNARLAPRRLSRTSRTATSRTWPCRGDRRRAARIGAADRTSLSRISISLTTGYNAATTKLSAASSWRAVDPSGSGRVRPTRAVRIVSGRSGRLSRTGASSVVRDCG